MEIQQLKHMLAREGTDINSRAVKAKLRQAERQAQKEASAKFQTGQKEKVTRRIQDMLAMLAVFFVATFLVAGNIATVIMFPIAEYTAVRRGIMAFEAQSFIASFNAATIVIGYIVLLFVKNVLRDNLPEIKHGSVTHQLYRNTRYTIVFIQVSIVLFGFLGRTSDNLIAGQPIGVIEIIGYSGTLVMTIALLAVTDITVLFIYSIFVNTVGVLDLSSGDKSAHANFLVERSEELQKAALEDMLIMAKQKTNLIE